MLFRSLKSFAQRIIGGIVQELIGFLLPHVHPHHLFDRSPESILKDKGTVVGEAICRLSMDDQLLLERADAEIICQTGGAQG